MQIELVIDLIQSVAGGIAICLNYFCRSVLETVLLVCGLSFILIPLQCLSNKLHAESESTATAEERKTNIYSLEGYRRNPKRLAKRGSSPLKRGVEK